MQILFEEGYEFGKNNGLNIISGKIKKLDDYNNKKYFRRLSKISF